MIVTPLSALLGDTVTPGDLATDVSLRPAVQMAHLLRGYAVPVRLAVAVSPAAPLSQAGRVAVVRVDDTLLVAGAGEVACWSGWGDDGGEGDRGGEG